MTVLVALLLQRDFHFEVNKAVTFTVAERRTCSKVQFYLLSVLGVLQLNKGDFVGVLAPQGSTVGVFQLQCLMLIVAFY